MGTPLPSRAALRRIAVPIGRSPRGPGRPMLASAHDEPRSGSNKSERESTSVRSTNYGSGRLVRGFRDIGRIFSLLFLLSHPSPIGHPLRGRVQMWKREYGFVEGK